MSMFRIVCVAVVLILASTAGAAPALQLDPEKAQVAGNAGLLDGLLEKLVKWLDRLTGGGEGSLIAIEADGCHLDPNGSCFGGS